MCTQITERAEVEGSGKGPGGWFSLRQATVYFDHPFHAPFEHTLNIDFVNADLGAASRVAVELSPASARALVRAVQSALAQAGE